MKKSALTDTNIACPECGHEIPLNEALTARIRTQLEAGIRSEHESRLKAEVLAAEARARTDLQQQLDAVKRQLNDQTTRVREVEAREIALKRRSLELEEQSRTLAERTRLEVEGRLRRENAEKIKVLVDQAEARVREQTLQERKSLEQQLTEQREKVRKAQTAELTLRREKTSLEERARDLDLEVARKLEVEKQRLEDSIRKSAAEEQMLKLKEKEKQINDLRKSLEEAKRRSELGSQELQGEVLELDIQSCLEQQYPQDLVSPVPKGVRGADLIQTVRNHRIQPCGTIIWESKNTRNWQPLWLEKLKEDQRSVGANIAVIVSAALPPDVNGFGQIDGVWIASIRVWPALATALREQLIQVAYAHASSEGKQEKIEMLYRYLAGDQFRQRVQGIAEAFTAMQTQLDRERRAMERLWKEREKQIERVMTNTVGMYGEMRGLIGHTLPEIEALSLDSVLLEDMSGD